ncbi:LON peptidase substrate-binding domain-containing protein [Algoriphagus sp. CAU 1675]|uniref:LON peptidase substrate-binding domain-containing protein n=1 Tax=Algoriphagus sp. CAU 1675 TaxID=3032597 RepID=UPI0023DA7B3E|nr:LON peptidase substrate-binding domain-containing protein [Algoriphagus sp. CAU 1675]MDF2156971.1 LON peptidase substrate-binding domain-containing protein [Algoriphagus sp. CAU 1675]
MFLPLFPLKLVVFPEEDLNLHIFEPRYRELLSDVEKHRISFGICTYIDQLTGYGTEVRLVKVEKRYDDGRLDIKTKGVRVFKLKSFDNPTSGKLYAGGEVQFLQNDPVVSDALNREFIFYLKEMLYLLNYPGKVNPDTVNSFTYAHKLGLKLEEESELHQMDKESERMEYLVHHFKRMIPVIKAVEEAKEKIKLNGHFKHLDPLNF